MTDQTENQNPLSSLLSRHITLNWEVIAFIVILLLAIFTRFFILGERVMSHDESLHTRFSYNLYSEGDFSHTPLMHGPILFHAAAFSYYVFGDSDFSARIYTAALGVLMVMSPWLFRQWLGRWGVVLASIMLLISPLMLYYHRYIRHDTPSIMAALIMLWAMLMYINGPDNQKRRAHWLYIIAFSMIWNLGSKETAFIYIAIFGVFLAIYFAVRLAQYFFNLPGKPIFYFGMMGFLLGGVLSLAMYIIYDMIQFDLIPNSESIVFSDLSQFDQSMFFTWVTWSVIVMIVAVFASVFFAYYKPLNQMKSRDVFIVILTILLTILWAYFRALRFSNQIGWYEVAIIAIAVLTILSWAYRGHFKDVKWREVFIVISIMLTVCLALVVLEEVSHTEPSTATTAIEPADPNNPDQIVNVEGGLSWLPMIAVWIIAVVSIVFVTFTRRNEDKSKDKAGQGFWGTLDIFPEFDLIIVIGTLILPWATALIPYIMDGTSTDFIAINNSMPVFIQNIILNVPNVSTPEQVGQVVLSAMAWLPLMAMSIAIGLAWNWRRWLIASAIFHIIFAFFFTTVFTNIAGLATGMVYSLGYWLEQQGVRRGSQPQYYYLLIIMPMYEFLPIIGGTLAMFAGMIFFWRKRQDDNQLGDDLQLAMERHPERFGLVDPDASQVDGEIVDPDTEIQSIEVIDDRASRLGMDDLVAYRESKQLTEIPFLMLFSWLGVLNLVGYSLAGEKMPWLGTHLTLPLIFLSAWFFGRIMNRIDWQKFFRSGWLALALMPVIFITGLQVFAPFVIGDAPFGGLEQSQLQNTYGWIASLFIFGFSLYILMRFINTLSWTHVRRLIAVATFAIFGLMTFRSAWMASFINYDLPNEFLVYAHAAPAIKTVLDQIEELSLRTTDGYDLKFAYDNEVSWPYSWYFRNYPNAVFIGENPTVQNLEDTVVVVVGNGKRSRVEPILEDRYVRFDHMRLWWPMQDYFYLTPQRIINTFDFSAENSQAYQIRRGIFDIWWSRDYTTYGQALSKSFELTQWPVSDTMLVYIRRDVAAQIWEYGVGDGTVLNPLDNVEENFCSTNWITPEAIQVITSPAGLSRPLNMSVDANNNLYVAEENAGRLSIFDSNGEFVRTFGQLGSEPGSFIRPNSVQITSDGNILVADTWNYRIQLMSQVGDVLASWGQPGEFGFDAPALPSDGFWGPRDVTIDGEGRVYVADTGNKRMRVYEIVNGQAQYVLDIGSGGSGLGELDEPSSLRVHPVDGRVFIADTWNRRISVFNREGAFLDSFRVRGWYGDLNAQPYLALDVNRDLIYVTDSDAGRVLVYDLQGNCQGSFGELGTSSPTLSQFNVIGGITVDNDGFVYVSDAGAGRVLKFDPFPIPEAQDGENADTNMNDGVERDMNGFVVPVLEVTEDVEMADEIVEVTDEVEITSEVTEETE